MNEGLSNPIHISKVLANELETILEAQGLALAIDELSHPLKQDKSLSKRDFLTGDAIGTASLVVSLVSLIIQIRSGNTYKNKSEEEIKTHLIKKLAEETSLPATKRAQLIEKLIEKIK